MKNFKIRMFLVNLFVCAVLGFTAYNIGQKQEAKKYPSGTLYTSENVQEIAHLMYSVAYNKGLHGNETMTKLMLGIVADYEKGLIDSDQYLAQMDYAGKQYHAIVVKEDFEQFDSLFIQNKGRMYEKPNVVDGEIAHRFGIDEYTTSD